MISSVSLRSETSEKTSFFASKRKIFRIILASKRKRTAHRSLCLIYLIWNRWAHRAESRRVFTKNFVHNSALMNSTWNSSQNFLVNSALPVCGIALPTMSYNGDDTNLRISHRNSNHIQKYFRMIIGDPRRIDWWKKPRVENFVTLCKANATHVSGTYNWFYLVRYGQFGTNCNFDCWKC
jgi:hypothetical protein